MRIRQDCRAGFLYVLITKKGGRHLGQPPFFRTRAPWGLRVNTAVQITVCRRRGQAIAHFRDPTKMGNNWRFGACLRPLGFFRNNLKNPVAPRVIIALKAAAVSNLHNRSIYNNAN